MAPRLEIPDEAGYNRAATNEAAHGRGCRSCFENTRLERQVAVLLERHALPLVAQHLERRDQPRARFGRLDDVVQVPELRRDPGTRELLVVLRDHAAPLGSRVGGPGQLLAIED